MALRSVAVKRPLVKMIETQFPEFHFLSESGGTYGFVRERPGYWYDFLPVNRCYQSGRGELSINWYWIGGGHVPDWYEWNGIANTPWRVLSWPARQQPDPAELASPLASPGPMECVCYQIGTVSQLPQALEVLEDKLRRYAIPALERPLTLSEERRLPRWRLLAEEMLPRLKLLEQEAPEELEALKAWQKQTARRWKGGIDKDVPPVMAQWREEIRRLPGFGEEWDISPILREWVFNWFTHALFLHP
ncbi:MAG: hypothetical protein HFF50_09995 [Lawsonibacter sp.]|nr:hypothetical protein [Lawsonibacter sp.]